jgi:hypothetical protein
MEIYQYIVSQIFGIILFLTFLNKALEIKAIEDKRILESSEDFEIAFSVSLVVIFFIIPIPLSLLINNFCLGY